MASLLEVLPTPSREAVDSFKKTNRKIFIRRVGQLCYKSEN